VSDSSSGFGDLPPELNPRGPRAGGTGKSDPAGKTPWSAPGSTVAKRSRGQRIAGWAAAATSVCVLLAAGGFWVIYHSIFGNIAHINAFDALAKNGITRPAADAKAENFLLIGSDTRAGADGVYQAAKGSADYTSGQRSDTMMLVHVPSGSAKASIISFPRDSWVTIPQWTDTKGGHHPEHQAKLNAAFSEGGAPLLVATLEKLSGIRVNHVVQIDFTGFKNMVNALGGITVCVKTTRHDHDSGDNLTAGANHLIKGDAALAFVRDRKGLPGGDIDRIADQQYFLSVVLHKVLSANTLTDPVRLYNFAKAAAKSMTTDNGFGIPAMKTLGTRLQHLDPAHVTFLQVPVLNSSAREGSQSVVELNTAQLPAVFAAMKDNTGQPKAPAATKTAAPTTPAVPLTVSPSNIRVRVANGSGRAHLAVQTATSLKAAGFTALTAGNATKTAVTTVFYGTGKADSARTVAAAVPGSVIKAKTSLGPTLELVIGDNFTSVVKVTVAGKTTGTKTTTTAPTTAPTTGTAAAVSALVAKAPTAASAVCAP
jgi:LCP family protein required for cell wall assembly